MRQSGPKGIPCAPPIRDLVTNYFRKSLWSYLLRILKPVQYNSFILEPMNFNLCISEIKVSSLVQRVDKQDSERLSAIIIGSAI